MIDPPHIVQSEAQLTAYISITVPRSEIQSAMGLGISEIMAALAAQGIPPAGPWFTHHLRLDPTVFDLEICVPVTSPVKPIGRVKAGLLPAARVARTVYHGSYDGLGEAWARFMRWIGEKDLNPKDDLWECYLVGPESSSDPATWQTELNRPLAE